MRDRDTRQEITPSADVDASARAPGTGASAAAALGQSLELSGHGVVGASGAAAGQAAELGGGEERPSQTPVAPPGGAAPAALELEEASAGGPPPSPTSEDADAQAAEEEGAEEGSAAGEAEAVEEEAETPEEGDDATQDHGEAPEDGDEATEDGDEAPEDGDEAPEDGDDAPAQEETPAEAGGGEHPTDGEAPGEPPPEESAPAGGEAVTRLSPADLAAVTRQADAEIALAVDGVGAELPGRLELPALTEVAPQLEERWVREHGLPRDAHHAILQQSLDGLLEQAHGEQRGMQAGGQLLATRLEGAVSAHQTGVDQAAQQLDTTAAAALGGARAQVSQAGRGAQAMAHGALRQASAGVGQAARQGRARAGQAHRGAQVDIETKRQEGYRILDEAIDKKADALKDAGKAKGDAAKTRCDELATEWAGASGDAVERLRGKIKARSARQAGPTYQQRFTATGERYAESARAQKATAHAELARALARISGTLTESAQRSERQMEQGQQAAEARLQTARTAGVQGLTAAATHAEGRVQAAEDQVRGATRSRVADLRRGLDVQAAQALQGIEQGLAASQRSFATQMQGIEALSRQATGMPAPAQFQATIEAARTQLVTLRRRQETGLQQRHAQADAQIGQARTQQLGQLGQEVQQQAQQAQADGVAAAGQLTQQARTLTQQAQGTAQGVGAQTQTFAGGVGQSATASAAQVEAAINHLKALFEQGLDRQKTAMEGQLDQQIQALPRQVGQAGDRAAGAKISEMGGKATAVRNACDGMGTNESAIMGALGGIDGDESAAIQHIYQDHYGRSLSGELRDELSGDDLREALAHLSGNRVQATLEVLNNAISWSGDDEAAIEEALRRLSPEELAQLREQAATDPRAAAILQRVRDNLGGHDLDVTNALISGDVVRADAIRLHEAMDGWGTDEAAVERILERAPTEEHRRALEREFGRYSQSVDDEPTTLRAAIADDFSGAEQDLQVALLDGDRVAASAARLEVAADGMGTDEDAIFQQLNDPRLSSPDPAVRAQAQADRARLRALYEQRYGRSLDSMITEEMGGESDDNLEGAMAHQYLREGRVDPELAIAYGVDGLGTNEEMVQNALRGRSAAEIEEIRQAYRTRFGRELDTDLAEDFSGSEGFEVEILMLGRPETPEQFMEIARRRHAFQRGGNTSVMDAFEALGFTESGSMLDANYERAAEFYDSVDWQNASPEERARLQELCGFVNDDAASYQAAKDAIAEGVVTAIELTGAVVATIVTAGATSAVLAGVICAAVTGAAAMGARAAIQGGSYGWEDAMTDVARTAVSAATAGLGNAGAVEAAGVSVAARVAARFPGASQWIIKGTEAAISGAIGGSLDSLGQAMFNEQAWDQGGEHWAAAVGLGALQGAASGFASGAVTGGMEGAFGQAASAGGNALREGIGGVVGDSTAFLMDPNIYAQDFDQIMRGMLSSMPQSFATGAASGYGAHHAAGYRHRHRPLPGGGHAPPGAGTHRPDHDGPTVRTDPDTPTVPVDHDQSTVPIDRDEPTIPLDRDEPTVPIDRDETTVPIDRDEPTVPIDRDETTVPIDRDETTVPVDRDEPTVRVEPDHPTTPMDPDRAVDPHAPTEVDAHATTQPDPNPPAPDRARSEALRERHPDVPERNDLQRVGEAEDGISGAQIFEDPNTGERFLFKAADADPAVQRAQERGVEQGTYAERAVAAAELAGMLGMDTPGVRVVEIDGQLGSLQEWVPDSASLVELRQADPDRARQIEQSPEFQRQRAEIEALDYLMNNLDRNTGNMLVVTDGQGNFERLVAIDHDLTFTDSAPRYDEPGWGGGLPRDYPPHLRDRLTDLARDPRRLHERFGHLGDGVVEGMRRRLDEMLGDMRSSAGIRTDDLPPDVMGAHQQSRVEGALAALSHADHARANQLLGQAQSPRERALLLKAIVAGNPMSDVAWFAGRIRGQDDAWLASQTRLTAGPGEGAGLRQQWHDTCGVTTAQALRGEHDPIFALRLRDQNPDITRADNADPTQLNPNLAADQQAMTETGYTGDLNMPHQGVAVPRDAAGGSGRFVDDILSGMGGMTGVEYTPVLNPPMDRIVTALTDNLAAGLQMPVVVGGGPDDFGHYVLAMDTRVVDGERQFLFHDPWDGVTVWRSEADVRGGNMDLAGWPHITAFEAPSVRPDTRPVRGDAGVDHTPRPDGDGVDPHGRPDDPHRPPPDTAGADGAAPTPDQGPSPADDRSWMRRLYDWLRSLVGLGRSQPGQAPGGAELDPQTRQQLDAAGVRVRDAFAEAGHPDLWQQALDRPGLSPEARVGALDTLVELADAWRAGRGRPDRGLAERIAAALEMSPAAMLNELRLIRLTARAATRAPGARRGGRRDELARGVEHVAEFPSLVAARAAAREMSGLGDGAVDFVQEIGPLRGRVTGRRSPDGARGWRLDWDPAKGFHVNWWDRSGGARRADWLYGANRIEGGTWDDFMSLLEHFP